MTEEKSFLSKAWDFVDSPVESTLSYISNEAFAGGLEEEGMSLTKFFNSSLGLDIDLPEFVEDTFSGVTSTMKNNPFMSRIALGIASGLGVGAMVGSGPIGIILALGSSFFISDKAMDIISDSKYESDTETEATVTAAVPKPPVGLAPAP